MILRWLVDGTPTAVRGIRSTLQLYEESEVRCGLRVLHMHKVLTEAEWNEKGWRRLHGL